MASASTPSAPASSVPAGRGAWPQGAPVRVAARLQRLGEAEEVGRLVASLAATGVVRDGPDYPIDGGYLARREPSSHHLRTWALLSDRGRTMRAGRSANVSASAGACGAVGCEEDREGGAPARRGDGCPSGRCVHSYGGRATALPVSCTCASRITADKLMQARRHMTTRSPRVRRTGRCR